MAIAFPAVLTVTGGTKTTSGSYTYHAFTSSSNDFVVSGGTLTADVLVVAGGGGGEAWGGGGGGAGGLVTISGFSIPTGTHTVVVGGGGGAGAGSATNGGDSTFGTLITAKGGGHGACYVYNYNSSSGGSGGGGHYAQKAGSSGIQPSQSGVSGTYGFGNAGGDGVYSNRGGGGGGANSGGAGGGQSGGGVNNGGDGGAGKLISAFDTWGTDASNSTSPTSGKGYFAGGGGGGSDWGGGTGGNGGVGGGSGNAASSGQGPNAITNTGGGAAGGGRASYGGNGGSGIVLVRYLTASLTPSSYTDANNVTWTYNGTAWKRPAGTLGPTGPSGPTGFGVNDVPRITSRRGSVTNASGGTITLYGSDFVSGCSVIVGTTAATSTTFVNSTQVTAVIPSGITAGTYFVYLINPDGGNTFLPNGLTIT